MDKRPRLRHSDIDSHSQQDRTPAMDNWYLVARWIHVIAATAWFGEVVTINFVLVPAVARLPREQAPKILFQIFPRIFKLASWLSATAVITGIALASARYLPNPQILWSTGPGLLFSFGATIGILLAAFHFLLEPRLDGMICTAMECEDIDLSDRVMHLLKIIPRVGLVVITTTLWTMMVGARGM
jgi:uncharacterized membrane protein